MESRRLLVACLLCFVFVFAYDRIVREFFPGLRPPAAAVVDEPEADAIADDAIAPAAIGAEDGADAAAEVDAVPEFESRDVTIGSLDPESGYFLAVTLTTDGAAIRRVELNDPRYRDLVAREKPLAIVGGKDLDRRTLAIYADGSGFDKAGVAIDRVPWELADSGEGFATFRLPGVNGSPELRKTYRVSKGGDRETDRDGYLVEVELTAASAEATAFDYVWQGPVSIPLENLESTRTFVELKGGFVPPGYDEPEIASMYAGDVVEEIEDAAYYDDPDAITRWREPPKFVGVDVQYFAALAVPAAGQRLIDWVESATPVIVEKGDDARYADVSLTLEAEPLAVPAGGEATHAMRMFFGPKRTELLDPLGAGETIRFAYWPFGWVAPISRVLLSVLQFFHHNLGLPYAIAIVLLTCCVRGLMLPISLKIAANGKKMKELQPEIEKLKKKYGDDKQGMMEAQMKLFADNDYNMLGGCLPAFLQIPIFIGLYNALYNAIDLRLARFLWVDNLAGPDHLFKMPFEIPYFGDWFNLLPLLTCGLYIVQQKMFMPPAMTEEAEMQQKVMQFMMVGMGLIFYHVPAGLCLYFIASASWTMSERKLIDLGIIPVRTKKKKKKKVDADGKPTGLLAKMMEMADEAKKQQETLQQRKR